MAVAHKRPSARAGAIRRTAATRAGAAVDVVVAIGLAECALLISSGLGSLLWVFEFFMRA